MGNYSNTRRLSGVSGDFVLNTGATNYVYDEPCAQLAYIIVRTKLGTSRANPKIGTDWDKVERGSEAMEASGQRALAEAFKPWRSVVTLEESHLEEGPLGRLLVEVVVSDPRRPTTSRRTVNATIE